MDIDQNKDIVCSINYTFIPIKESIFNNKTLATLHNSTVAKTRR